MRLSRPHIKQVGFSLIEVMIAITILAVTLTTILGNYQILNSTRADTQQRSQVADLGRCILDRIVAADMRALGLSTATAGGVSQPWSLPRIENEIPVTRPPLGFGAVAADNLVAQGLAPVPLSIPNLAVYIEYYRGVQRLDPVTSLMLPGVMDAGNFANREDFGVSFRNAAWRAARQLSSASAPYLQVGEDEPVVVRVVITWANGQRLEYFTTKRRPPGG